MTTLFVYTDGGCSGNEQRDLSKRKMVSVVSDSQGNILIEKITEGGSSNIAELIAVKEALLYAKNNGFKELEIRTDSKNNFAWVLGEKVGQGINDRPLVLNLKTSINAVRQTVNLNMVWIPREENVAGDYIEKKYAL